MSAKFQYQDAPFPLCFVRKLKHDTNGSSDDETQRLASFSQVTWLNHVVRVEVLNLNFQGFSQANCFNEVPSASSVMQAST